MEGVAVFIRGINVGKANRIRMSELMERLTKHGYDRVESYLQSGNLRVVSTRPIEEVVKSVELSLVEPGIAHPVAVGLSWERICELVTRNPFDALEADNKRKLAIFPQAPSDHCAALLGDQGGMQVISAERDVLFGLVPLGQTHTINFKKLIEKPIGGPVTSRFWNVIEDWVARSA